LSEYCATIVPQLPSKAPSAYAYLVAVIDTSARQEESTSTIEKNIVESVKNSCGSVSDNRK